jgi:hypothetical protein
VLVKGFARFKLLVNNLNLANYKRAGTETCPYEDTEGGTETCPYEDTEGGTETCPYEDTEGGTETCPYNSGLDCPKSQSIGKASQDRAGKVADEGAYTEYVTAI